MRMIKSLVSGLVLSVVFSLAHVLNSFADDGAILASCKKDLKLSDSGCDCVVKAVAEQLNEAQTEMLVIMIGGDNAAIGQAMSQGKISGDDMLALTNFMTTTPAKCEDK